MEMCLQPTQLEHIYSIKKGKPKLRFCFELYWGNWWFQSIETIKKLGPESTT